MRIPAKIGAVQIDSDAVRLAVVNTGGRAIRVLDLVETPVRDDSDDARVAALKDALDRLKARPSVWVLLVPASWSILRLLTVPFRSARKIGAAVPFELEPTLAVPIDELVVDYLPARTRGRETEVLAVGVRRNPLASQVALAARAGITIEGAYLDAIALTSMWSTGRKRETGARGVLHFRANEALLGVVEDGKLAYLRRLESDPTAFRASPANVAREVRNLLRAYAADRGVDPPVDSLSITGAQVHEAGRTIFESDVDLPVRYEELGTALAGFSRHVAAADAVSDEFNRWSAPIAAAVCAAGGPFQLNLLQPGVADAVQSQRSIARSALAVCLAGAIVAVSYLALVYLDNRRTLRTLDQYGESIWHEFEAVYPDIAVGRPGDDLGGRESFRLLQDAAEAESTGSLNVSLDAFRAPTLLDILDDISDALPPGIAEVEEINIRPLRGYREVIIRGRVVDSSRYNDAVDTLDASRFMEINRDQSTRITASGRESFTLRARI